MNFQIRPMEERDVATVFQMESELFTDPWSMAAFEEVVSEENWHGLVAAVDKTIIGYGIINTVVDESHLANIAVAVPYRQKTVAATLLTRLIAISVEQSCRSMILEVRVSNMPARAFYEKHGFSVLYSRSDYYLNPPEQALVYRKMLTS